MVAQMKCLTKSTEELCQLAGNLLTQCTEEIIGEASNHICPVEIELTQISLFCFIFLS